MLNLFHRQPSVQSVQTTNEHLCVSERRGPGSIWQHTHKHSHADIDLCVGVCVCADCFCIVCMSPASSRPTLIWADGCHGSGSRLLHSSINSMAVDRSWSRASTASGGQVTDRRRISKTHTKKNLWYETKDFVRGGWGRLDVVSVFFYV